MKKILSLVSFFLLTNSCTLNHKKNNEDIMNNTIIDEVNQVECKPQREILVQGKCLKRRGFM